MTTKFLARLVVPRQVVGGKSNVEVAHACWTTGEAEGMYQSLKLLLLNVTIWNDLIAKPTARFRLTDAHGMMVQRQARVQDRIRIILPGPSASIGRGYDWVRIKRLVELKKDDAEIFYLTVSPSSAPQSDGGSTAHFLKRCASTTFLVVKDNLLVSCLICSRNEIPNVHGGTWQNRWRNGTVGFLAGLFLSKWQWNKLANALMDQGLRLKAAPTIGSQPLSGPKQPFKKKNPIDFSNSNQRN